MHVSEGAQVGISPEGSDGGFDHAAKAVINPEGQGGGYYLENRWQRERRQKKEKARKADDIRKRSLEERKRHWLQQVPPVEVPEKREEKRKVVAQSI